MMEELKIKITCPKCKKIQYIQVIPGKYKLYPKFCGKCSYKFSFLRKLKNYGMWFLIGIRGKI